MANTAMLRLETVEGNSLRFSVRLGSGQMATLDSGPGSVAPNPIEMVLASLGGCEGMDVISILRKKRQRVTGYEIAVNGERSADHPKKYTRIEIVHRVRGHGLSATAIAEAIRLSETRYCSVHASLDPAIAIINRFEIVTETSPETPTTMAVSAPALPAQRRGMSELILRVADVPRSIAFYRDIVGITLERQDSPEWAWFWTGAAGTMPRLGLTSRPLSFGAAQCGGPAHFALAVPRAAIPAEQARLEALGIEVEGPITFEFWKADSIYFSDPDGHRAELCGFEHMNPVAARV